MADGTQVGLSKRISFLEPQLVADRRDFHRYAESGWTEFRTAATIAKRLTELGWQVQTGEAVCSPSDRMGVPDAATLDAHWKRAAEEGADPVFLEPMRGGLTGVVGLLRQGSGPTVGLRFDVDALDLVESTQPTHRPTSEGFASIHPGVCHACGHDGHASVGLGIAHVLLGLKSAFRGSVKLIFQPAEEGVRGARSMVAAGVVDDVDFLLGHHLVTGCAVGQILPGMGGYAATRKFDVTFHGAPAHAGGSPEGGRNALLAASTAVLNLYALPRHREGFTRINVGRLSAGSGRNVIPAEAHLAAEVRGENDALCESMYKRAMTVIEAAAAMHGCTAAVQAMGQAGTANSDASLASLVQRAVSSLPDASFHQMQKMGGSEDFTEMMVRVQSRGGLAANIGVGADLHGIRVEDKQRERALPAHTGEYDFDERALSFATLLLTTTTLDLLKPTRTSS